MEPIPRSIKSERLDYVKELLCDLWDLDINGESIMDQHIRLNVSVEFGTHWTQRLLKGEVYDWLNS